MFTTRAPSPPAPAGEMNRWFVRLASNTTNGFNPPHFPLSFQRLTPAQIQENAAYTRAFLQASKIDHRQNPPPHRPAL